MGISIIIGVVILATAIPYVARIRHPGQKALAAYLIFVSVFAAAAVVLYSVLAWLAGELGLAPDLAAPGPAILFTGLIFLPAVALATWQARKPPKRHDPPD